MWICDLIGWSILTSSGLLVGMFWLTWSELISALFMVTVTGVLVGFCNTEIQYEYE